MSKRVVILDVDGTLIDSNDAHAQAWVDTGTEFGHAISFDEVRRLIGMGGDKVLPRLTGLEDSSDEGKKLLERRGEIFRERYLPGLSAFPDTRELLERMRADGYDLVIATSASDEDLAALLEQAGVADLMKAAATADDAEESKPAPDIVEAALQRAGCGPEEAVMIGDTPYDVKAAIRAGVDIVAVRCGGWADGELEGAVEIYDAPADLLLRYDASVFGGTMKKGSRSTH